MSGFGTGMIRRAVTGLYQDMHFGSADVQTWLSTRVEHPCVCVYRMYVCMYVEW